MMTKIEGIKNAVLPGAVYGVAKVAEEVQTTPEVVSVMSTAEIVGIAAVVAQLMYLFLKNAREARNSNSQIALRDAQIKDLKNGKN